MALTIPKKDVNNEIVLLRQCVRQARIRTINKLVREAKRLRTNHGNEKQLERNKNKADKFLREIFVLKLIKDDEISRFGIANLENLQVMLENPHTDDRTRAIAKVVRHKSLTARIMDIKIKFPDCQKYISLGNKKHLQKRKRNDRVNEFPTENLKQSLNGKNDTNIGERIGNTEDSNDAASIDQPRDNVEIDGKYDEPSKKCSWQELEENKSNKQKLKKDRKVSASLRKICDTDNFPESDIAIKAVSKEAAVKRFTDILQETNTEEISGRCMAHNSQQWSTGPTETVRRVDDFFLNSHEVIPDRNFTKSSEEKEANSVSNVDDKALWVRSGGAKFHRDGVGKERRNNKRRKISIKDISRDRNTIVPANIAHSKRNDKIARIKEESVSGNLEAINAKESEKLHPSWAARRKQQEIIKQGFQGKKIRFDES